MATNLKIGCFCRVEALSNTHLSYRCGPCSRNALNWSQCKRVLLRPGSSSAALAGPALSAINTCRKWEDSSSPHVGDCPSSLVWGQWGFPASRTCTAQWPPWPRRVPVPDGQIYWSFVSIVQLLDERTQPIWKSFKIQI